MPLAGTPLSPFPASPLAAVKPDLGACLALLAAVEAFDGTVLAAAALLVFPPLFFPYWGEWLGALWGLGVLALGFALWPAGRVLGPLVQRFLGPTGLTLAAGLLLAGCTVATGLLPAYGAAGSAAVALLVLCRVGQGVARGACPALPLAGHAAEVAGGVLLGLLAAVGVLAALWTGLVHADFVAWGWRYPFCAAIALHLVALLARLRLAQMPGCAARDPAYEHRS